MEKHPIEDSWLRRMGTLHFVHIDFRGVFRFSIARYARALLRLPSIAKDRLILDQQTKPIRRGSGSFAQAHLPFKRRLGAWERARISGDQKRCRLNDRTVIIWSECRRHLLHTVHHTEKANRWCPKT